MLCAWAPKNEAPVNFWVGSAAIGILVTAAVTISMALVARAFPPGRTRELVAFLPNCVTVLRRLRSGASLPLSVRLALGAALCYVISPIQLIPNVIPVIGQTDDLVVAALALRFVCRRLPPSAVAEAWPGDASSLHRLLRIKALPAREPTELTRGQWLGGVERVHAPVQPNPGHGGIEQPLR